jgi:hypothetical protein
MEIIWGILDKVNRKLTEVLKEEEQDKKLSNDIKKKREETQSIFSSRLINNS